MREQTQLTLIEMKPFRNRNLFSNHYLESILPQTEQWKTFSEEGKLFDLIALFKDSKHFPSYNEAQLEEHLIKPVLKLLGFEFEVQADVGTGSDYPDYALFGVYDKTKVWRNKEALFKEALTICEAKRWDRELDRPDKDKMSKSWNPSFQIWVYLNRTEKDWGILTNGRKWRLYHKEPRTDKFFEIDLSQIVEKKDVKSLKYFWLFFSRKAFESGGPIGCYLDSIIHGSVDYAKRVGEDLKENVYNALRIITQGFFDYPSNQLNPSSDEELKLVQNNTMRLLYRMLFILYSEGKGLLSDEEYLGSPYSLYGLKNEIAEKVDQGQAIIESGTSYWSRLRQLFDLINFGSEKLGINREQFYVPAYNGGLFDSIRNPFLTRNQIGDKTLAKAIDLLVRSKGEDGKLQFVDYSTLDVRHLGSIYEGLLEYQVHYTVSRKVASGADLIWQEWEKYATESKSPKPFEEFPEDRRVEPGRLYVATSNGERKNTGSYYTPDYIVRFIVERSLSPLILKKKQEALDNGTSLADAVLSTKVLDPAMGSGHFLVGTIDYLSTCIMEAVQTDLERGLISNDKAESFTLEWAKREVVSNCIYGVDLNEVAVELAKVSLWLTTICKDRPLSFLDHRLKCGNSLIGAKLDDIVWLPGEKPSRTASPIEVPHGLVQKILDRMKMLQDLPEDTVDQVKDKERLFLQLKESDEYGRITVMADVNTGLRFINCDFDAIRNRYMDLVNEAYYGNQKEWAVRSSQPWAKQALHEATARKFFNWEMEYPEIFFENGIKKVNPGFDAVIGNPPYVRIYRGRISDEDVKFLADNYQSAHMKFDLYVVFMELGLNLTARGGYFSMIVPDKWTVSPYGEPLRKQILSLKLLELADLRGTRVFEDATVENVIPIILKTPSNEGEPASSDVNTVSIKKYDMATGELTEASKIPQRFFLELPMARIRMDIDDESMEIVRKMESSSIKFGQICYVNWGLRTGTEERTKKMITDRPLTGRYKRLLRGEDIIDRYDMKVPERYIDYDLENLYNPMFPEFFENEKIVVRKICGKKGLMGAFDESQAYCFSTLIACVPHSKLRGLKRQGITVPSEQGARQDNIWFLTAILNSSIIGWYYKLMLSDGLSVVPNDVKNLPVPIINFQLDENECRTQANAIRAGLIDALELGDQSLVQDFIIRGHSLEPEVKYHLIGILAEEMTKSMNTIRYSVDQFLGWLQSPSGIGRPICELRKRAEVEEYYKSELLGTEPGIREIEKILKSNQIRLGSALSMSLSEEYRASSKVILPLKAKISFIDAVIDSLCVDLYNVDAASFEKARLRLSS